MKHAKSRWLAAGVLCLALWPTASTQETRWKSLMADARKAYEQVDYTEAEKLLVAALKEAENFGEQDPRLATSVNNLALLYKAQGRYPEAEPLYQRALTIQEKVLGPEHPDVASSLENYAALLRKMNRDAEAEKLEGRAQAIRTAALPASGQQDQKPPRRVRVSSGVQQAKLVSQVAPVYPPIARAARVEGVVRLEAIIGTDGTVQKLEVIDGNALLVPSALQAVQQWRYEPTLLNNEPVEVVTFITVIFRFARSDAPGEVETPAETQTESEISRQDVMNEVIRMLRGGAENVGGIIWFPAEYFGIGHPDFEHSDERKVLIEYTLILAAVGKYGAFGSTTFVTADEIRSNARIRDAEGNEYASLEQPPQDIANFSKTLKIMYGSLFGQMGENMAVLIFPGRKKNGKRIANPTTKGSFSLIISNVVGGEQVVTWKLPLTSLSPPKFCPVGHERVEANWNYCPWHGVPLNGPKKNQQ